LLGGKRRTVTEFQAMAHTAGLELVATGRQPSGHFVVECRPRVIGCGYGEVRPMLGQCGGTGKK
jgi:hypothetical protein